MDTLTILLIVGVIAGVYMVSTGAVAGSGKDGVYTGTTRTMIK